MLCPDLAKFGIGVDLGAGTPNRFDFPKCCILPFNFANTPIASVAPAKLWQNIFVRNGHFSLIQYPGVAQLVGRLVWELEHQNGSTSRNVSYSPFTPQFPLITSVESWVKLW